MTYEQFAADFRINFAVVRALEIVGEATKRLPPAIRDQYPQIPWRGMAGMRDKIIHGYDNVDLMIVWDTVKQEIPIIRPLLQRILQDYEGRVPVCDPGRFPAGLLHPERLWVYDLVSVHPAPLVRNAVLSGEFLRASDGVWLPAGMRFGVEGLA